MAIELDVTINESKTVIQLKDNQGIIELSNEKTISSDKPLIYVLLKAKALVDIGHTAKDKFESTVDFDQIITIMPTWDVEIDYVEQLLAEQIEANGIVFTNTRQVTKVPASAFKTVNDYVTLIGRILATFGYPLAPIETKPVKKKPAKAQHRWNKEVSQVEFYIDSRESKATVMWQKRNEMLLKAGAKMKPQAELNKDGSVGFSAKMGEKIRFDHQDKIKNFTTTEDIILKSVNEVGLFLYFGGTNSWLELLDAAGKSIDEYTVVK
ncbi:hypothetical protein I6N95_16615 [Vagococcus sp. BWB3-3]|uniref:Uncharacterized protein n=1 Tax=Vagococcus allomyrinae TaxID=2794353 RepID=A0A940SWX3_9ENTE|nr:hypothetical protein [Vagococcus allomyrinae]MBP1042641.1 hypothetical protein [Vagococcus allomyrinae]